MVVPCISSYYDRPCVRCGLHSSCLLTRRLSLSNSGPDRFPMCFQILSLLALWRASGLSIALCRRCRFRGEGLWVIVYKRSRFFFCVCFPDSCIYLNFLWHFGGYRCNIFIFACLRYFMTFSLIFSLFCVFKFWINEFMYYDCMNDENMNENEWMDVWKCEWMIEIR